MIEEICELYFKTMNTRLEAVEKNLDAKYDRKEVKEMVRQKMDANHTCRPNDDESRSLQTTYNSEKVVQETVKEINGRKDREANFLIFNAPVPDVVGWLCNEVCILNLDVKDEITKVIRLSKKQTDGDAGDTEQKPRPHNGVIKDTKKGWNCLNDYQTYGKQRTSINVSASKMA